MASSKYYLLQNANAIFAQSKPIGKPHPLVDLRKMNTQIADAYINNNHPVSISTDAAQHTAGKNFFCKLDCSQAYQLFQMAAQQSIGLLAINFPSRTFSFVKILIQISKLINANNTLMTLASLPIPLKN